MSQHTGEPIASMQGLVDDAPVLYVGSFSKTMFPALRIGFVVLPRAVAAHTAVALQEMLRGGHRLEQLALADFIDSGEFGRHLGRMRRLYRERQQALRDALTAHFAPSRILGGNCGMHLTLRLSSQVCDRTLAERALAERLNPRALSGFALQHREEANGLVIGYGSTPAEQLARAVGVLADLVGEERVREMARESGRGLAGRPEGGPQNGLESGPQSRPKTGLKTGLESEPKSGLENESPTTRAV